jgi:phospholipase C
MDAGSGRERQIALVVGVLALALAGAGVGRVGAEPHAAAAARPGPAGRIEHVIIFYQENHSFDEVLGEFCRRHNHRCDGHVGKVRLSDGTVVRMHKAKDIIPEVWHNVLAQQRAINGGKMDGWDKVPGCNPPKWPRSCLQYYTPEQIPNFTKLAGKYTVNDRMFSMYDSPSYGGHIYVAAATQDGFTGDIPRPARGVEPKQGWGCESKRVAAWRHPKTLQVTMEASCIPARPGRLDQKKFPYNGAFRPTPVPHVPTIFDRLDGKGLSWKIYTSLQVWAVCPYFAECLYSGQAKNMVSPYQIVNDARGGALPAFALLLPGGVRGTSQHNGSSMRVGDNWIGQIMGELQRSPQWPSTAVFITYDDCGCFYDHVRPGKNPDGSQQGIRLPMVIAGGYAKRGYTDHTPATLAGLLKFTEDTYGLAPLGVNDAKAYNYRHAFDFSKKAQTATASMRQYAIPAASRRYLEAHPPNDEDEVEDPT